MTKQISLSEEALAEFARLVRLNEVLGTFEQFPRETRGIACREIHKSYVTRVVPALAAHRGAVPIIDRYMKLHERLYSLYERTNR